MDEPNVVLHSQGSSETMVVNNKPGITELLCEDRVQARLFHDLLSSGRVNVHQGLQCMKIASYSKSICTDYKSSINLVLDCMFCANAMDSHGPVDCPCFMTNASCLSSRIFKLFFENVVLTDISRCKICWMLNDDHISPCSSYDNHSFLGHWMLVGLVLFLIEHDELSESWIEILKNKFSLHCAENTISDLVSLVTKKKN